MQCNTKQFCELIYLLRWFPSSCLGSDVVVLLFSLIGHPCADSLFRNLALDGMIGQPEKNHCRKCFHLFKLLCSTLMPTIKDTLSLAAAAYPCRWA